MSWHLQKADESTSPQPGGSSFDEFLRRNVVMATLEDMWPGGVKIPSGPLISVSHAVMWKWPQH